MEGNVLIIGKHYNAKKVFKLMIVIGIVQYVLLSLCNIYKSILYYKIINYNQKVYSSIFTFVALNYFKYQLWISLITVVAFIIIGSFTYLWLYSYELTVTDKRIYGKMTSGKQVDLPIDSVFATATTRFIKGVSVSTASGKFTFRFIKNADEIYEIINNLLIERQ